MRVLARIWTCLFQREERKKKSKIKNQKERIEMKKCGVKWQFGRASARHQAFGVVVVLGANHPPSTLVVALALPGWGPGSPGRPEARKERTHSK
jgi:hypothetical protein